MGRTTGKRKIASVQKNHKDTKALSITKNLLYAAWCLSDFVVQNHNRETTRLIRLAYCLLLVYLYPVRFN
jgi:hypothetical protein